MIRWTNASWRERLKLMLFSLIPVLLIVLVAQACAYMTIDRTVEMVKDPATGQTHYSMTIGHWPWSHKSWTPINSLGLPDEEFVDVLPKGRCVHVLLAGDSYTFGDGTSWQFRWGNVLKGMAERRLPDRCIRFFNIGVRNTTIDTTIVRIHQVLPLIEPDVVIFAQYQNDLTDLANPGSPAWVPRGGGRKYDSHWGTRLARIVPGYNNSLVRLLTYSSFTFMIKNDIKYDVLSTWSVLEGAGKERYADSLKTIYRNLYASLVKDMRDRRIELAVLSFPSKMDLLAKRSPEGVFFAALASEYKVPYLSLMPALDANRAGMPFYLFDGHMNEFGNEVAARAVWDWLFTSRPAPVAALQAAPTSAVTAVVTGAR